MSGPGEGGAAWGGSGAPGMPAMPERPKELISSSGEKITLFGPLGPAMLDGLMMLVSPGSQATVDGDNKAGTIKAATMSGAEVTADYKATDASASSLGIELPKAAERESGFQVSGRLPEEQAQMTKMMFARMQGESEAPPVTEADLKFAVSCGVYVMKGTVAEAGEAVKKAGGSKLGQPISLGDDNQIFQFSSDPTKFVWVQAVPDSDQTQISVVSLTQCPDYVKSLLEMMPAMAARAEQASEGGGGPGAGGGPGGPPGMTKMGPGGGRGMGGGMGGGMTKGRAGMMMKEAPGAGKGSN